MDLDHTERYVPMDYGGPPGQTARGNLGPFARPGHRAVTHGRWQKHQPEPGYYVIRSPIGYVNLVTNQGTLGLGHTPFSAAVWEASKPSQAQSDTSGAIKSDRARRCLDQRESGNPGICATASQSPSSEGIKHQLSPPRLPRGRAHSQPSSITSS